jgi:hypothetical protein
VREGKWYFRQLFVNGVRKQRARSPNKGYFQVAGEYLSEDPVRFKFRDGDLKKDWVGGRVELVAFNAWIDLRQHIRGLDETSHVVTLSSKLAQHIKETNARYYVENAPEALDAPGEWYLDAKSGVLSYLAEPGEDLNHAEVIAPVLAKGLLRSRGDVSAKKPVQHVVIRGLTFSHTDWAVSEDGYEDIQAAVMVRGDVWLAFSTDWRIEGCTFAHLGNYALEVGIGCQRFQVVGNEIYDIGAGGIRVGDPYKPANPFEPNFGHVISDNHLHQLGRVFAPGVGIIIFQSGQNRVAHNHIHDLYYTGISVGWNWGYKESPCRENIIEFNHIHDVGQGVLSDLGGIYTLGIQKGTVLRNNLIHDVTHHGYGSWGIYADEGSSGILMENNVVYRCRSGGFGQHYGRENIVRNNIFAFGAESQLIRGREEDRDSFVFTNNIVYFDSGDLLGTKWKNDRYQMDYNIYFDARPEASKRGASFAGVPLKEWRRRGHDVHSLIADPRFVAPKQFDFRLEGDSPALKLGFKPIDLSEVGVRRSFREQVHDTDRKSTEPPSNGL